MSRQMRTRKNEGSWPAAPSVTRCHQMLTSCKPGTSAGWRAWICGHAPANATTGASTNARTSAMKSRTGVNASTPIRTAPASAIGVMTSIPGTQLTVVVERATVIVSKRTSAAVQKRPPSIDSRAFSQSWATRPVRSANAASGPTSRVSGDTYRIPGPHEPREVVARAHHVEVDVLAQVKAGVLVRSAEAGGVEVEDDQARPAAADGLHQPHPIGVGAGRDHGDRPSGQAADAVPRQRLGEGRPPVGLADREVVQDQPVLAHRAVRLEDGAARVVGDQPDLAAAAVYLRGHRGGEANGVLDRRLLAVAEVHTAVEVEEDPEVGGQRQLEGLGHQPLVLGRERQIGRAHV